MSTPIYSTQTFVGRKNELEVIEHYLHNTDLLLISGEGGIGKTSLLNHFVGKLIGKDKDQQPSLLVTQQPLELDLITNWRPVKLLMNLSKALGGPKHFPRFWEDATIYNASDNSSESKKLFCSHLEKLPYESIVLVFDTFERGREDIKSFLGELSSEFAKHKLKTKIVIAGRPEAIKPFQAQVEKSFPHISVASLKLQGLSVPEIREYFDFKLPQLEITEEFIERLVELTNCTPILIALVIDWLRYGNLPENILSFSIDQAENFKQALIEQVNKLYYPVNHILLAMAYFHHRCNIEFLKNISLLQTEHEAIFASLADFSFVKYHPASDESEENWTLHDEMRNLIIKYVWAKLDPQYELRQTWTKKALHYYDRLISLQEGDEGYERERYYLECEKLFYLRFINKQEATKYRTYLWRRAKNIEERQAIVDVFEEFNALFMQLQKDELDQLAVDESIIHFQRTHYAESIKTLCRLLEQTEGDDTRQAEVRSRLLFSYINAGDLDAGEKLALESIPWLEYKLKNKLEMKSKDDFECRKSTFLNGLGYIHRIRGKIEEAVKYYERALTTIPLIHEFDAERTAIKINLAYVLHMQGEDNKAISHCQTALLLSKKRNDLYRLGLAHNVMGIIEANALRAPQAEEHFRNATKSFEQAESKRGLALVSIAHARMHRQIEWHKANPERDANSSASSFIEKAKDEVSKALSFIEEGNYSVIIEAWSEMGAICRELGQHNIAINELNCANEYFNDAIEYFTKSISLAKATNDKYAEGEATHGLGLTYFFKKDYELAKQFAELARAVVREESSNDILSAYTEGRALRTIANIAWQNQEYPTALQLAVDSFINIMKHDQRSLSDSKAKKAMFEREWLKWIREELVIGKNPVLSPAIIRNNCETMLAYWKKVDSNKESLAKSYPGFIITLEDTVYMSDLLGKDLEQDLPSSPVNAAILSALPGDGNDLSLNKIVSN